MVLRIITHKIVCRKALIRGWYMRKILLECGKSSRFLGRVQVYSPQNITIGNRSVLNEGCILNARDTISIGNDVHLSHNTIINTSGLNYQNFGKERTHNKAPVVIGDGVWLGSGVIVNPGVSVGENSVVGAGSVVTKDIPVNVVAVGVPAKVIKNIV